MKAEHVEFPIFVHGARGLAEVILYADGETGARRRLGDHDRRHGVAEGHNGDNTARGKDTTEKVG